MLPPGSQRAHDLAVARGESLYRDPGSGRWVMTAKYLTDRGYCCGNGCRHCPYPPEEQRRAGRPGS
ncbi:MAG: hypothetical protein H6741_21470 [Alphaproteobacteria bacterium]|nr:hypothetical protein [Alphaproteobacteria bacterium]